MVFAFPQDGFEILKAPFLRAKTVLFSLLRDRGSGFG